MKAKQKTPERLICYPGYVTELLRIRGEIQKGIPLNAVLKIEAQNYKYGKEAFYQFIKNQIEEVFDFSSKNEEIIEQGYYSSPIEDERAPYELYYNELFGDYGEQGKVTEINENTFNRVYYYFSHEGETKILNELLEYLQNDTVKEIEQNNQPKENNFTVPQWSVIFYHVESTLYKKILTKKAKIEEFKKVFKPKVLNNGKLKEISPNTLSQYHREIARVIEGDEKRELRQKHIDDIKTVLPFLKNVCTIAFNTAEDKLRELKLDIEKRETSNY